MKAQASIQLLEKGQDTTLILLIKHSFCHLLDEWSKNNARQKSNPFSQMSFYLSNQRAVYTGSNGCPPLYTSLEIIGV